MICSWIRLIWFWSSTHLMIWWSETFSTHWRGRLISNGIELWADSHACSFEVFWIWNTSCMDYFYGTFLITMMCHFQPFKLKRIVQFKNSNIIYMHTHTFLGELSLQVPIPYTVVRGKDKLAHSQALFCVLQKKESHTTMWGWIKMMTRLSFFKGRKKKRTRKVANCFLMDLEKGGKKEREALSEEKKNAGKIWVALTSFTTFLISVQLKIHNSGSEWKLSL